MRAKISLSLISCLLFAAVSGFAMPGMAGSPKLEGKVIEVIAAGSYVYLHIDAPSGKVWAATPAFEVKKGDEIKLPTGMPMRGYQSKTLKRTFDTVYFTTAPGEPAAEGASHKKPEVSAEEIEVKRVAKAKGPRGKTVAEIYAGRKALAGREIRLRGTVVKYSEGILGRNWVHIQDGTGDAKKETHDILATTSEKFKVGEVVTIKGLVKLDMDFGYGYSYATMIEKAFPVEQKKSEK